MRDEQWERKWGFLSGERPLPDPPANKPVEWPTQYCGIWQRGQLVHKVFLSSKWRSVALQVGVRKLMREYVEKVDATHAPGQSVGPSVGK